MQHALLTLFVFAGCELDSGLKKRCRSDEDCDPGNRCVSDACTSAPPSACEEACAHVKYLCGIDAVRSTCGQDCLVNPPAQTACILAAPHCVDVAACAQPTADLAWRPDLSRLPWDAAAPGGDLRSNGDLLYGDGR